MTRSRATATPENMLIAIIKVKMIILCYKAYKCDSSIAIGVCGVAISSLWRVCESSILKWNIEWELEATYWNGAKNLILTTVYSIACKFDALADMEELHIQKSSDLPNTHLIFRFELHFGYNMELQPNTP